MKAYDLLRLAAKSLRTKAVLLPLFGFAAGAFCLCVAGTVFLSVRQEKAQPFELTVLAQGRAAISDATVARLSALPGVTAATQVVSVPVVVKTGVYRVELTLTGIGVDYLGRATEKGEVFPQKSVMPYIVLNHAVCRLFAKGDGDGDAPPIDWLNAAFTVQAGGTRSVVSKVCGILTGDGTGQPPAAYISLSTANALLREAGQTPAASSALVRVKSIGAANSVSEAVRALGLAVADSNGEQQAKWNGETEEACFLLAMGLFALLCGVALQVSWRQCLLSAQRQAWSMLLWQGFRQRDIRRLFVIQAGLLSLAGAAIGIAAAALLPSLLQQSLTGSSIFLLPVPALAALADLVICPAVGLVCIGLSEKHSVLYWQS